MFNILRKPFGNDLLAGLFFLACSYIPSFLPARNYGFWGTLILGALYYLGAAFLANYVIHKLSGKSLLHQILGSPKSKRSFIRLGLIGAIPFSLAVCDFGGFWYFPHWSWLVYYIIGYLLLGWVFYFLFLTLCYEAFKLTLDHLLPQQHAVSRYYGFERKHFRALGVVGGWIAIMIITVGLQNSRWLTHFRFVVDRPKTPFLVWYWWLIALAAWVILCEYVEYKRKRSSLLKDTLHGYFNPLLAVILCGVTLALTNEVQNLPIGLWRYTNYPWAWLQLFHVPAFVILGWPLHIVAFIEFWRAFGHGSGSDILFANSKTSVKHKRGFKRRAATPGRAPA